MSGVPRRGLLLLRDALIVAVIALVVFQVLRKFVGDYYRVPSGSMEPFLHGDPQKGDVVYVDSWSKAADCGRNDVVVVQHPDAANGQLVKRIAASGDDPAACCIEIFDGDVWLGPDTQHLARACKEPNAARKMRSLWARWPGSVESVLPLDLAAGDHSNGPLVVPSLDLNAGTARQLLASRAEVREQNGTPIPTGFVGTRGAVDATYLTVEGRRGREGEDVQVFDCGLDLRLRSLVDAMLLVLETRSETFAFYWVPTTGRLELWRDGVLVEGMTLVVTASGAHRIEYGSLDDHLFFILDGRSDATVWLPRRPEWKASSRGLPQGPRTRLFTAALGTQALMLDSLQVFRDVYHERDRIPGVVGQPSAWPITLQPGHWFLLGDNAFDSRDSRQFGPVPAASYLGRPRFVLGPWPRHRWLEP